MNFKIPSGYKIKTIPEWQSFVLADNGGLLRLKIQENNVGAINMFFDFKINATQYPSNTYEGIKDLFAKAVQFQSQSLIVLEKI